MDQFIASAEDKWRQTSRLGLLLPHGSEGQGPEHSSARIERYLQLCADGNMQVCNATNPAQYFHLLRRQMRQPLAKPLVLFTPKSLLRLPAASSPLEALTSGGFRVCLDDPEVGDRALVERILFCSGKVYYDLRAEKEKRGDFKTAIVRLEQLYPFPEERLAEIAAGYPKATPHDLGAGRAEEHGRLELRLRARRRSSCPEARALAYVGRAAVALARDRQRRRAQEGARAAPRGGVRGLAADQVRGSWKMSRSSVRVAKKSSQRPSPPPSTPPLGSQTPEPSAS